MKQYINTGLLQRLNTEIGDFPSGKVMAKFLEGEFIRSPQSEIQTNTLAFSLCEKTNEVLIEDILCMCESGKIPTKDFFQWLRDI